MGTRIVLASRTISAMQTRSPYSNEAIFGPRNDAACVLCGSRHHARSRQNRDCRAHTALMIAMIAPANVREQAERQRAEAEHHMERARAAEARGADGAWRRAEAMAAYAKADAWETGADAATVLGEDVARAFALRAAGLI